MHPSYILRITVISCEPFTALFLLELVFLSVRPTSKLLYGGRTLVRAMSVPQVQRQHQAAGQRQHRAQGQVLQVSSWLLGTAYLTIVVYRSLTLVLYTIPVRIKGFFP